MSLVLQRVPLNTDGTGACTADTNIGPARLLGVSVEIGSLVNPTITLTDEPGGAPLLVATAVAASKRFNLAALLQGGDGADTAALGPPMVLGRVHVVVAGGGATKAGELVLFCER